MDALSLPPTAAHLTLRDYNDFLVKSLESHDTEKRDIIMRIDEIAAAQDSLGDVRTQLLQRTSEFHSAQRNIVDLKAALAEEREKTSRLIAENQTYQATLLDERAKLHTLLAMRKAELEGGVARGSNATNGGVVPIGGSGRTPVLISIPHKRTNGFGKTTPTHTLSLRSVVANGIAGMQSSPTGASDSAPATVADSVSPSVRVDASSSLHMGHSTVNGGGGSASLVVHLSDEVRTLKTLLDDQRSAFDHERIARVAEERSRAQEQSVVMEKMSRTIDHLQKMVNLSTKELVETKHQLQTMQRKLLADIEVLSSRLRESEQLLDAQRARHTDDLRTAVDAQRTQTHDLTTRLREVVADRDERHAAEKEKLEKNILDLTRRLELTKDECERERRIRIRVEHQHKAADEGHQSDLALLKQQLRRIEKRLYFTSAKSEVEAVAESDSMAVDDLEPVKKVKTTRK
jgi:hypothetical protein